MRSLLTTLPLQKGLQVYLCPPYIHVVTHTDHPLLGGDAPFPSPENPREALKVPDIACFFHHYIREPATWYTLSDASRYFATQVPDAALDEPLLFSATIALSAIHIARTSNKGARAAAEFYHAHCVRMLIGLDEGSDLIRRGVALATTSLLRSYEILDADMDPNRHLWGAYSFASGQSIIDQLTDATSGLSTAGFWNYLREDITFSLYEQCGLKISLDGITAPSHTTEESYVNSITLILGQILNTIYANEVGMNEQEWNRLLENAMSWHASLPSSFQPFSHEPSLRTLPRAWYLRDCHGMLFVPYLLNPSFSLK